jgi:hypothetical protein
MTYAQQLIRIKVYIVYLIISLFPKLLLTAKDLAVSMLKIGKTNCGNFLPPNLFYTKYYLNFIKICSNYIEDYLCLIKI